MQLLIPSTIPLIISEPQLKASLASPFTKFTALSNPPLIVVYMLSIVLEMADFTLPHILVTVDFMVFITDEIVEEMLFQTEEMVF